MDVRERDPVQGGCRCVDRTSRCVDDGLAGELADRRSDVRRVCAEQCCGEQRRGDGIGERDDFGEAHGDCRLQQHVTDERQHDSADAVDIGKLCSREDYRRCVDASSSVADDGLASELADGIDDDGRAWAEQRQDGQCCGDRDDERDGAGLAHWHR